MWARIQTGKRICGLHRLLLSAVFGLAPRQRPKRFPSALVTNLYFAKERHFLRARMPHHPVEGVGREASV
eukprot:scaffold635_cov311-Pinguiococcus_pyrenoidosus.AAC.11